MRWLLVTTSLNLIRVTTNKTESGYRVNKVRVLEDNSYPVPDIVISLILVRFRLSLISPTLFVTVT